jgi:hypothetical protein
METKTISQKPERYSKKGNDWVISAKADSIDGNIKPVTLTPSSLPFTLKPLIKTDGVIVNVDDIYLVSQKTLDIINQSNNPHYDLKVNGVILWKGTNIQMGNTIPIVKIKISNLTDIAADRDTKNKNAGVSYVDYIYEGESIDGVPINLIKQIDYTLMPDEQRPKDKFGVWSLNLGDDTTVYSIDTLKIQTAQEDGKLDKNKLSTFLTNISERLKILRNDFNMIKDVFYNAKTPDNVGTYDVSLMAQTNPPEEIQPVVFKYTTILELKETPQQQTATQASQAIQIANEPPPDPNKPKIVQLRMKQQGKRNNIPIFKQDPSAMRLPKAAGRNIYEGNAFWGYLYKDNWKNNKKIWMVYEADKTTFVGYGIADSNDYVEEIK